jgi:hypothetical protein
MLFSPQLLIPSNKMIPPVVGGVTLDVIGSELYTGSAGTTVTYSGINVGSGGSTTHLGLVAVIAFDFTGSPDPSAVSATWNGTNMTLVADGHPGSTLGPFSQLWGLAAPATGSQNLVFSWTTSSRSFVSAVSFTGVLQTGGTTSFPNGAVANSTATISITSNAGDMVVGTGNGAGNPTILGTTIFNDSANGSFINAWAGFVAGAAGSTTVGTNTANAQIIGVDVAAG